MCIRDRNADPAGRDYYAAKTKWLNLGEREGTATEKRREGNGRGRLGKRGRTVEDGKEGSARAERKGNQAREGSLHVHLLGPHKILKLLKVQQV